MIDLLEGDKGDEELIGKKRGCLGVVQE